jgi:hypothetical protein
MVGLVLFLAGAAVAPPPTPTPVALTGKMTSSSMSMRAGESSLHGRSLAEVAKGVKLRFPSSSKPTVITNDSLKALGAGAELTTAAPVPAAQESASSPSSYERQMTEKKAYWQDRYFSAQQQIKDLEAQQKRLAADAARLERDFYSRDDPYQRDNVIKPAWDETVTKLRDVEHRLEGARSAPDAIANDARHDGALPGWFREAPPVRPTPSAADVKN